jgi:hypothetical protein
VFIPFALGLYGGGVSPSTLGLDVRFAQEAEEIAGDTGEPEAGGDEPELRGRRGGTGRAEKVVARGREGEGEDVQVDKVGEVFEGLVRDVGEALGEGDGVEIGVWWVGGGEEGVEPVVEGKQGGEAEGRAGMG